MAEQSAFVDNEVRDQLINKLLNYPENKVSQSPPSKKSFSSALIARARTPSGVVLTSESSYVISARVNIDRWESISHLLGR